MCSKRYGQVSSGIPNPIDALLLTIEAKKEERVWDKCKLNLFKYKKMVKYRINVSFYEWKRIDINSDESSISNECDSAVCSKRYGQVSGGVPSLIIIAL